MRLIDVNDFLAKLKKRHEYIMQDPEVSKRMKWCEAVHYGATTAIIEKMPTIEATPVVHGRWIEHTHFNAFGSPNGANYECSNCHYDEVYAANDYNYCPNCGAKMDGGVSDG